MSDHAKSSASLPRATPDAAGNWPGEASLSRVADACALATAAIGLLGLAGWLLGIEPLARVLPGLVAMKFNTALAFVLGGAALWWRHRPALRLALGALMAAIGALALGEYLSGGDWGIDQLFFREVPAVPAAAFPPGRMSPSSALCFLLCGVALVCSRGSNGGPRGDSMPAIQAGPWHGFLVDVLAFGAAAIAGFVLVGYATGTESLRHLPGSISMALNTAAAFVLLAAGILCAASEGMIAQVMRSRATGRALWLGFGLLTLLLATLGVTAAVRLQSIGEDVDAQAQIARPRSAATRELETGVLDYTLDVRMALAGDAQAPERLTGDNAAVERQLAEYEALAQTDQQQELLARFAAQWRDLRALGQELLASGGPPSKPQLDRFAARRLGLENFLNREIQPEAQAAHDSRQAAVLRDLQNTEVLIGALLLVGVLIAMVTSKLVGRAVLGHAQALHASEARLRLAQNSAHLGIWERLPASGKLIWTSELERLYGYAEGTFPGTYDAFRERVHPDDRAEMERRRDEAITAHQPFDLDFRVQSFAGETRWVNCKGAAVYDANGQAQRIFGVNADITEHKRAEEALRESEEKYRVLFESIDQGFCTIEVLFDEDQKPVDYRFLMVNPAFERQTGIQNGAGRRMREIAPLHEEHWFQVYGQIALTGEPMRFENTAAQLHRHYDVFAWRIGAPAERKVAILFTDITERKRAHEALRESEERFRVAQELSPDGFSILRPVRDPEGRVADFTWIYANAATERAVGMKLAALAGRSLLELFPGHRGSPFFEAYRQAAETRQTRVEELLYQGDGVLTQRWFRVSVVATGQDIAVLSQDITERKHAEGRLREANTELQRRIAQEQAANAALREARRAAVHLMKDAVASRERAQQASAALQLKEAELREAQRVAHVGSWHWDAKTDVTTGSDEMLRLYGFDPGTQTMPDFKDQRGRCYPVEDWERINAAVQKTMETGVGYELDVRLLRNGATVWATTRSEVVRDAQGQIVGLRGTVQDITTRKQAEAALRESEERLTAALGVAALSVWEYRPDTDLIEYDQRSSDIFGTGDRRAMTLEEFLAFVHLEDRQRVAADIHGAFDPAGEGLYDTEYRIVRPDGAQRWLTARGHAIFTSDAPVRQLVRCLGTVMDITKRKRAEHQLKEEKEFSAGIIRKSPAIICGIDSNGTTTFINPAGEALTGYSAGELIGNNWWKIFYPGEEYRQVEQLFRDFEKGEVRDYEMTLTTRDGKKRTISWNSLLTHDNDGNIVYSVGFGNDVTERKRAEEALHRSAAELQAANAKLQESNLVATNLLMEAVAARERIEQGREELQLILDSSPAMIFYKDRENRFLRVNRAFAERMGLPKDQLEGRSLFDLYPREQAEAFWKDDREVIATGKSKLDIVEPMQTPAGVRWVETHKVPSRDAAGNIIGVMGFAVDITERKRAVELLHESEERFRTMANAMPQLAWIANADGWLHWYNHRWYEYTGTTPDQMEGWGWQSVHDPAALPNVLERWKASIATGEPFEMTFPLRGADGAFRLFLTRGFPLKDAAGRVTRWFGTNTDVTELKRAEEALRASESFHRQTLESIPGMVFTTRPDGYCDYQSQQWVDYTGVPMVEHLGDGWNKLQHPDDRPRSYVAWNAAVQGKAPYDLEYRVRRHDGVYEWFKVIGRPIRDGSGQIVRWFGVAINIQGIKDAEAVIKASLTEKEVLLKEIHHRVKNNLQVISSLVELQTKSLEDPRLRGLFQDVRDRVRSMALVHEKLYQSESLAGVEFADYARSLIRFLTRAHRRAETPVRLKLDLQPVSLPVETAVPCGLILNELITNAFKHAFRGRGQGEVTTTLRGGPDGRVSLRVSDDGVGLPAGLNWRESQSLGLRLIHLLAGQLDASVEVKIDGGTEFLINFAQRPPAQAIGQEHA